MSNTHSPGKKLTFLRVAATTYSIYNSDKNILEDIFGKILVLHQEEDRGIKLFLVTQYKGFQSVNITCGKRVDELVVGQSG
jgi:hypothetical protein